MEEIKQICPYNSYEIGYASLSGLLRHDLSRYKYGLSLARKLDDSIIDKISNGPTNFYYDHYFQINNELNQKTEEISNLLQANNIEAFPISATLKNSELEIRRKEKHYGKRKPYT